VVGGYNHFWLAGGTQLIVVDGQKRSSLVIDRRTATRRR